MPVTKRISSAQLLGPWAKITFSHLHMIGIFTTSTLWPELEALTPGSFLIGLSSVYWREAWKYGERAGRYCFLDVGHAIAAIRYSAYLLGYQVHTLDHWNR